MVTCPVCKGSKGNPFGKNAIADTCRCCMGEGEINEKTAAAIKSIARKLAKRLKVKGYC